MKVPEKNSFDHYKGHFFSFFQVSGISFAFDGEKPAGQRIDPAYIKIGDEYLNPERTYRMVTKAYLANGKDGYDVLAKCNQVCQLYGNTGCEVFKRGIKKLERFLPKNQHTQRKLLNFENWCSDELSKILVIK